jgi:hypothetical protein
MDHREAQTTKATERYLLGEMSEPERFDFENHYFECEECAGDVRASHALARGIKAVCAAEPAPGPTPAVAAGSPRKGWFAWLTPSSMAPAAVAAGFAIVAGYQAWIVIPGLESRTGSRAMAPIVLRAAARGDEQTLDLRRDQPISFLSLDVNGVEPGTPLTYDVIAPGGEARISSAAEAPPEGSQLIVMLSTAEVHEPGAWKLILRTKKGMEVARYPFTVQLK